MVSADDFIRYLGRLEANLERIHSTTPVEQRDRVCEALATLMNTAAAFYRQKHIEDIKNESDARLAELHKFNGSKGAFLMLHQPINSTDQIAPHTPTPTCRFRFVTLGWI
jgi:hypothetical protein